MSDSPQLVTDLAAANTFLDFLYRDREGIAWLAVDPIDGNWNEVPYQWPQQRSALLEVAMESAPWADVYVSCLLFTGSKRSIDSALPGKTLWVDVDHGLAAEQVQFLRSEPAFRVVKSGTPGHSHVYLQLADSMTPDELRRGNWWLVDRLDGDSGWQVNGVRRLPGTFNHKSDPPQPVLLAAGGGPPVALGRLQELVGDWAPPEDARRQGKQTEIVPEALVRVPRKMQEKLDTEPEADTSDQLAGLVKYALEQGYTDGEVLWLAEQSRVGQAYVAKHRSRSIAVDVARMLPKDGFRPDHTHPGEPCDVAGCPNRPGWMTGDRLNNDNDGRPRIETFDAPRVQAELAWDVLVKHNDPPRLFRSGGLPVRLEEDDTGRPKLTSLTNARMTNELAKVALWVGKKGKDEREVKPPGDSVTEMLATPNVPLPILNRIVAAPVFGVNGDLQSEPGYHLDSRTLYVPDAGFQVDLPPEHPSDVDLAQAADCIDELLWDFPFEATADRAHAVALLLLPFVRDLIDGPTPLHLFDKPTPGTGASLLSEVLLLPALGTPPGAMSGCSNEDEWRKRLTSLLSEGPTATVLDNLTGKLDSPSFCAAITATTWKDRILGGSNTGAWPVRTAWVVTANNLRVSTDIARRTVRVRIDAKSDRPWEGRTYRHNPLREWVQDNRTELVWSALCVGRAWMDQGRPPGKAKLGSFENWAKVIGGLLDVLGIEGFLQNTAALYEQADSDRASNLWLVERWWSLEKDRWTQTSKLYPRVADDPEFPVDLGFGDDQRKRVAFGTYVGNIRGRVFPLEDGTQVRVERSEKQTGGSWRWRLVRMGDTPELPL